MSLNMPSTPQIENSTLQARSNVLVNPEAPRVPVFPGNPIYDPTNVIYFPRTNHLANLSPQQQVAAVAEALKQAGPKGVMVFEGNGTYGLYTPELMKVIAEAKRRVPQDQLPQIEIFASGGRPLKPKLDEKGEPITRPDGTKDGSPFAQALLKIPNGIVAETADKKVTRLSPNWGNADVWKAYYELELKPIVQYAKDNGFRLSSDDHAPAVQVAQMGKFMATNNIWPAEPKNKESMAKVQDVIASRFEQVIGEAKAARLPYTLSMNGTPLDALNMGINIWKIKNIGQVSGLEFQLYRDNNSSFKTSLDTVYAQLEANIGKVPNLKELRIAVSGEAKEKKLSAKDLEIQDKAFKDFEKKVEALYKSKALTPPDVRKSLFPYNHFYQAAPEAA